MNPTCRVESKIKAPLKQIEDSNKDQESADRGLYSYVTKDAVDDSVK